MCMWKDFRTARRDRVHDSDFRAIAVAHCCPGILLYCATTISLSPSRPPCIPSTVTLPMGNPCTCPQAIETRSPLCRSGPGPRVPCSFGGFVLDDVLEEDILLRLVILFGGWALRRRLTDQCLSGWPRSPDAGPHPPRPWCNL